jgi:hypothetical protein
VHRRPDQSRQNVGQIEMARRHAHHAGQQGDKRAHTAVKRARNTLAVRDFRRRPGAKKRRLVLTRFQRRPLQSSNSLKVHSEPPAGTLATLGSPILSA